MTDYHIGYLMKIAAGKQGSARAALAVAELAARDSTRTVRHEAQAGIRVPRGRVGRFRREARHPGRHARRQDEPARMPAERDDGTLLCRGCRDGQVHRARDGGIAQACRDGGGMIRYFATVAGFGRVSSFRVAAVSPAHAHARARALEMYGITVEVKPSSGHVGDDFDL